MPGYYNSATGMVASFIPTRNVYAQYGLFDGNLATGRQTGLTGPLFNGYLLHLAEAGVDWTVGPQTKPGKCGAGYWKQTGALDLPGGGTVQGAEGIYMFALQRLFYEFPGESNNGVTAYFQFAATNSPFISTQRYFGCGLTYFGPCPGRDADSAGFAFAYGRMNPAPALDLGPRELIYTCILPVPG